MPQKQLPVSPEGKKKKESKGEIQISHIEVPPPAKPAELKRRDSALLLQLLFVSCSGTFIFWPAGLTLPLLAPLWWRAVFPRFPATAVSPLHPDCRDGRGRGSTPGWESGKRIKAKIQVEEDAKAGGLWDQGSRDASVLHLCLPATLFLSGKMHQWALLFLQLWLSANCNSCSHL